MLYIEAVLKNFAIFTGKHLCWSLFNKVAGLKASIVKAIPTQVFSCEYCEIFKKPIWKIIYKRLLLKVKLNLSKYSNRPERV